MLMLCTVYEIQFALVEFGEPERFTIVGDSFDEIEAVAEGIDHRSRFANAWLRRGRGSTVHFPFGDGEVPDSHRIGDLEDHRGLAGVLIPG